MPIRVTASVRTPLSLKALIVRVADRVAARPTIVVDVVSALVVLQGV